MSISQSQTVQDVLSTSLKGMLSNKQNAAKFGTEAFNIALQSASNSSDGWSLSQSKNVAQGNEAPLGGNHMPRVSKSISDASTEKTKEREEVTEQSVKDRLAEAGIDIDTLEQQVVGSGLMTSDEFNELLESPDDFFAQLNQWLEEEPLFARSLMAQFPQLAEVVKKEMIQQSMRQEAISYDDMLVEESESAAKLVGKLLDEKGRQQSSDDSLNRERFFSQLLMQKATDSSAKPSGFAFDLAATLSGSTEKTLLAAGHSPDALSSHGLKFAQSLGGESRALPQLPILKGLPGQPGATEALNERIMMMRAKGLQMAEIRLDPPELGALTVKVKVTEGNTSIQFHSPHLEVREALESQVQRLREMMDSAGITLGDVGVSDQSLSERSEDGYASHNAGGSFGHNESEEDSQMEPVIVKQSLGLVDYFA
ncbi:hook-length control protein FliK [Oceanospirillum multiglobuliferum]|uniref:Flagellar hook-length control protein-like C-terminal domain-containing protein n=1 Tax=Oceanospirillum multiglobuliferum TaxID=64969 RepID=A0A1T4L465_9GAMM|nr:flagellar hook-length control protein FliK [Oceanospirillum multiglobuliferum]OPX56807.1 hypothetical protein BTE48_02725 [Oceanospirillum multiglobuliferum]SJZ49509.1 hook-length control protein FliK [Oceanospirillum multiglobuliferum]